MKVYTTIMPGILSDFQKMLSSSAIGETVTEEYRLEDGKGAIVMTGIRHYRKQRHVRLPRIPSPRLLR